MMHNSKLVCSIKVNGKALRELKDEIRLPFGEEYSIYLKNLNSVRVRVKIEIDGEDIADGTSFIIEPNSSTEIERFIRNGNFNEGNKFKFIERTAKVEEHRNGIQPEDGLIRIEYEFERERVPIHHYDHYYPRPRYYPYWDYDYIRPYNRPYNRPYIGNRVTCSTSASLSGSNNLSSSINTIRPTAVNQFTVSGSVQPESISKNDAGITAPGSKSDQKFVHGYFGTSDGVKHVMVFKLLGHVGEKPVERPITVKTKNNCMTCGTVNPHDSKFCKECGGGLELL